MYQSLIRPFLFSFDPERAHSAVLRCASLAGVLSPFLKYPESCADPRLNVEAFGLRFPNPIGLAAGFDKDGRAIPLLHALGFGHLEIGTITGQPQSGNERPRMWRFASERAVVNALGFPSEGVESVAARCAQARKRVPSAILGVNIGKTKVVPLSEAVEDYLHSFRIVSTFADYVTINISSPNTPGLRELQRQQPLDQLLGELQGANSRQLPLLVKISPDLQRGELEELVDTLQRRGVAGVIATNTTLDKSRVPQAANLPGGLSGEPLFESSLAMVRTITQLTKGGLPVIGVGGISSVEDVWRMIGQGAALVQIYTGLVFEGPGLIKKINLALREKMEREGLRSLVDLRGSLA